MVLTAVALLLAAADQPETTVEVPFRLAQTAIFVDATVNGRKASLLFDSGFGGAVVIDDTIDIGKKTGVIGLQDFVGTMQASTVKIKTLKVGSKDIPASDLEAVLIPGTRYDTYSFNTHMDGLLGLQALMGQAVEINFEKRKFVFYPKSMDISKRVPDNKRTFLLKMLPIGFDAIVLEAVTKDGKKLTLALDTGNSFFATTHKEVLERIGAWEVGKKPKYAKQSGVATGNVDTWTKKLTDMKIFGVPVPAGYWDVIDLPSSAAGEDGTVGFGFLSNFNITIDYERRRVWLENFTGKAGNEEPGDVGLGFMPEIYEKRVVVDSVAPESPADKAGIKVDDQLLAIDGKDLPAVIGVFELRRRMEGPIGSKVKLDFTRGGQLIRVELQRISLVND